MGYSRIFRAPLRSAAMAAAFVFASINAAPAATLEAVESLQQAVNVSALDSAASARATILGYHLMPARTVPGALEAAQRRLSGTPLSVVPNVTETVFHLRPWGFIPPR
ncbi:MAG: hypothetical protein NVSMB64_04600 [Candidatus Velthaea sp.]